jgi:hypothetical protein
LIISTESGKLLACSEPIVKQQSQQQQQQKNKDGGVGASSSSSETGLVEVEVEAKWISVREVTSLTEEVRAAQLLQQQQSLYHVATSRIRSICGMGGHNEGLVTASSSGEIRCWIGERKNKTDSSLTLYECTIPIQVGGRTVCVSSNLI